MYMNILDMWRPVGMADYLVVGFTSHRIAWSDYTPNEMTRIADGGQVKTPRTLLFLNFFQGMVCIRASSVKRSLLQEIAAGS